MRLVSDNAAYPAPVPTGVRGNPHPSWWGCRLEELRMVGQHRDVLFPTYT
jgi:hypothetical protein